MFSSCKVADFGLSKELVSSANSYGSVGTLAWSAPETFDGIFNERSDVFSFGIVLYEIASRTVPYTGVSRQKIDKIVKERFTFSQKKFSKYGESEEEQLADWCEENPIANRRPDTACIEASCPEKLRQIMEQCWASNLHCCKFIFFLMRRPMPFVADVPPISIEFFRVLCGRFFHATPARTVHSVS